MMEQRSQMLRQMRLSKSDREREVSLRCNQVRLCIRTCLQFDPRREEEEAKQINENAAQNNQLEIYFYGINSEQITR